MRVDFRKIRKSGSESTNNAGLPRLGDSRTAHQTRYAHRGRGGGGSKAASRGRSAHHRLCTVVLTHQLILIDQASDVTGGGVAQTIACAMTTTGGFRSAYSTPTTRVPSLVRSARVPEAQEARVVGALLRVDFRIFRSTAPGRQTLGGGWEGSSPGSSTCAKRVVIVVTTT